MERAEARHELEMLLLSLPPGALWRWLTRTYPELADEVTWEGAPPAQRVRDVVAWLDGAGLIDAAFFEGLAGAFEGRAAEVRALAAVWQAFSSEEPPTAAYPTEEARRLAEAIGSAEQELETRALAGADTQAIRDQLRILEVQLKRALRQGRQLRAPDVLSGRYRLVESIGTGGFAEVWKAWDVTARRVVAVKVLHGQFSKDQTRRERFFRGARKMQELAHPAVVEVLEVEGEDDGLYYFVMEYLCGGNLYDAVMGKQLTRESALRAVLCIGEAVAQAHAQEMVHRDIKPQNILLDGQGRAKLTDFDLVKAGDTTAGTRTVGMGTFVYAAPELLTDAKRADHRSDLYALGATALFAHLCAPLPPEVIYNRSGFFERMWAPGLLKGALEKALAHQPEDRFVTAGAFCRTLQEALVAPPLPPQSTIRVGSLELAMMNIPPGAFWMGATEEEKEHILAGRTGEDWTKRLRWEMPHHEVRLTQMFSLSWHLVTQALYNEVMGKKPSRFGNEPAHPVENLSWVEAIVFCNRLSERQGLPPAYVIEDEKVTWIRESDGYRLPTEAEWEYAARAGTTTPWSHGHDEALLPEYAWFSKDSQNTIHPVGEKKPNPWGLYDMHGNVWDPARNLRSASRSRRSPGLRSRSLGFRLARGVLL